MWSFDGKLRGNERKLIRGCEKGKQPTIFQKERVGVVAVDIDKGMQMRKTKNTLLVIAGSLSLALGVIGIAIPLLPTTPFLLLAATCYVRSSQRLYSWLIGNRILGVYIRSYMEMRAISRATKIAALLILWGTIGSSLVVVVDNWYIRLLLVLVGIAVSIHLVRMRNLPNSKHPSIRPAQRSPFWRRGE